jgi:hypothetical protein
VKKDEEVRHYRGILRYQSTSVHALAWDRFID